MRWNQAGVSDIVGNHAHTSCFGMEPRFAVLDPRVLLALDRTSLPNLNGSHAETFLKALLQMSTANLLATPAHGAAMGPFFGWPMHPVWKDHTLRLIIWINGVQNTHNYSLKSLISAAYPGFVADSVMPTLECVNWLVSALNLALPLLVHQEPACAFSPAQLQFDKVKHLQISCTYNSYECTCLCIDAYHTYMFGNVEKIQDAAVVETAVSLGGTCAHCGIGLQRSARHHSFAVPESPPSEFQSAAGEVQAVCAFHLHAESHAPALCFESTGMMLPAEQVI